MSHSHAADDIMLLAFIPSKRKIYVVRWAKNTRTQQHILTTHTKNTLLEYDARARVCVCASMNGKNAVGLETGEETICGTDNEEDDDQVNETVHETHTANKDDEAFNTKSNDSYIEFFELRFRHRRTIFFSLLSVLTCFITI